MIYLYSYIGIAIMSLILYYTRREETSSAIADLYTRGDLSVSSTFSIQLGSIWDIIISRFRNILYTCYTQYIIFYLYIKTL